MHCWSARLSRARSDPGSSTSRLLPTTDHASSSIFPFSQIDDVAIALCPHFSVFRAHAQACSKAKSSPVLCSFREHKIHGACRFRSQVASGEDCTAIYFLLPTLARARFDSRKRIEIEGSCSCVVVSDRHLCLSKPDPFVANVSLHPTTVCCGAPVQPKLRSRATYASNEQMRRAPVRTGGRVLSPFWSSTSLARPDLHVLERWVAIDARPVQRPQIKLVMRLGIDQEMLAFHLARPGSASSYASTSSSAGLRKETGRGASNGQKPHRQGHVGRSVRR